MDHNQPCSSYIDEMPEELLVGILSKVKCKDLARLQQVSSRLKRLINQHSPHLNRLSLEQLTLRLVNSTAHTLGRFQQLTPSAQQFVIEMKRKRHKSIIRKVPYSTPNVLSNLRQILWNFEIGHFLNFEGVKIDTELLAEFNRSSTNLRNMTSLNLLLCNFLPDETIEGAMVKEFGKLLSRCSSQGLQLSMELCTGSENLLRDEVFRKIQALESLHLQLRASNAGGFLPFVSDLTLEHWGRQPPSKLRFGNIQTGFTLKGVFHLVQALKKWLIQNKKPSKSVDWELGTISTTYDDQLFQHFCNSQSMTDSINFRQGVSTVPLPIFRVQKCSNCVPVKIYFEGNIDLLTGNTQDLPYLHSNNVISSSIPKSFLSACSGYHYKRTLCKKNVSACRISFFMHILNTT